MLRIRAAAGLVAALLLLSSGGSGIPAVPMRLVMEAVYGTHLPGLANLRRALPSSSSSVSSNPRSLARHSPQEILDKVSRGSGDAGLSTASFWAAKMLAPMMFAGFPSGPTPRVMSTVLRRQRTETLRRCRGERARHPLRFRWCRGGGLVRQGRAQAGGPQGFSHARLRT